MTDAIRTPDEVLEGIPDFPFQPSFREWDGLRLAHLDQGQGQPVLFFHGEPTWSFLWRKVMPPVLEAGYRCIAPDLPGFGRSDKPVELEWYSYDRHTAAVAPLLEELDVRDAIVVVQDWGGPIGLRWAVENPDRAGALAILNTGLFTGRVSKGFLAWRNFAERNPDLPVGFVIQGATATELPDEVVAAYEAPFPNPESKAGAAQFPLIVPTSDDAVGAADMGRVLEALGSWDRPALVAFSDSDPVFPYPRAGQVFCDAIPTAGEQVKIEGAAHFLQEDRGKEIAEAILERLG